MNYTDRHVVVTGGTGALGTAVVAQLIAAGAICHVPYRSEEEAKRFPHRESKQVSLVPLGELSDEAAVNKFYAGLAKLWASIHIAGGFAFAPVEKSDNRAGVWEVLARHRGVQPEVKASCTPRRIRTVD